MALDFPSSPTVGQLFPVPAVAGAPVWKWDGAAWVQTSVAGSSSLGAFSQYEYTATASQTTFSGADINSATLAYTVGYLMVFVNGTKINKADYTATNGTSVVFSVGLTVNDQVTIITLTVASVLNSLLTTNNLSDLTNVVTARTNLGAAPTVSPTFTGSPIINNVGQGLLLIGNGVTTPSKAVRCNSGIFQVVNDANTAAILNLTDAGDLSWTGGAWTTYTPTVTVTGGGAGTGSGRYKVMGKTVALSAIVNVTTGGSACGFTLPPGMTSGPFSCYLAGREQSINGFMYNGQINPSVTSCTLIRYDNSFPVTAGLSIVVTGTFEIV